MSVIAFALLALLAAARAAPQTPTVTWFHPEFDPMTESLTSFAHGPLAHTTNPSEFLEATRGHNVTFAREARESGTPYLNGFFVWGCQLVGLLNNNPSMPVSRFDTRFYSDNNGPTPGEPIVTYTIDRTYYVGDDKCNPVQSDVLYKTILKGIAKTHGINELPKFKPPTETLPVYKGELEWTGGSVMVSSSLDKSLITVLNDNCPCGGTWEFDKLRYVDAKKDCGQPMKDGPTLCRILSGNSDYYNYQWTDNDFGYVTSQDDFDQTTGWANDLIKAYVRVRIPQSHHTDSDDCDYILWDSCGSGIIKAARNCEQCDDDLEDDGCIFREVEPDWDSQAHQGKAFYENWNKCCPCIYKYAKATKENEWLKTAC